MEGCTFVGLALPGGTCAQWFSGTTSAFAVVIALGANFYAAWRQWRTERKDDAAEIASISMVLRILAKETSANVRLFEDCKSFIFLGRTFFVTSPIGGVSAKQIAFLNKGQADVLFRCSQFDLAERLDGLIGNVNLTNLGIEDYSRIRSAATSGIVKYRGISKIPMIGSTSIKEFLKEIQVVSEAAKHFKNVTTLLFEQTVEQCIQFNRLCDDNAKFTPYRIDVDGIRRKHQQFLEQGIPLATAQ